MKLDIIGEAAKIIEDNPVDFTEDFLLDILKIRFRWPKKSIEVISNFGNPSEDFFDYRYQSIIFDKWYELYSRGFTTMLNNCLDIHPDMRKLETLLLHYLGELPTGNIYMSAGTTVNRPSFDLHSHEYNVVSTSIYGTTKWLLDPKGGQFTNQPLEIKKGDQVVIPSGTPHACIDAPEKRCSLTICLG
jgi:hypothetical protein